MTEARKNRIRTKIQDSRSRLMGKHPFFALLLMYLKFIAVPDMRKISTNGRCIYFSPDFIDKLHWHELDYILCHQIMHLIQGHIWRETDLAGDNYHFACDILVNVILERWGFTEERYAHLGYVYKTIPASSADPLDMTPEQICAAIPYNLYAFDDRTRNRFLPDTDSWWDLKEDCGLYGELILDTPDLVGWLRISREESSDGNVDGDGGASKQEWKARAKAASEMIESAQLKDKQAGTLPDFSKRLLKKMKAPVVDWKKLLNDFIQERVCDYSFSPPDRRFEDTGFFLPDFNEKEFVSKEILFMVDTSGSIDDNVLSEVYSEIRGAIEQFNGKLTAKLGFFDADVKTPMPFESIEDLMTIIPVGGGGTDFRAIFDYLRECCMESLPACIVIFTDGEGPYPPTQAAMGIPVLWLIHDSPIVPPWGKVVHIIHNKLVGIS